MNATEVSSDSLRLYFTAKSWIEGDALQQFKRAAALDGVCEAAALPDLHPGRGLPVGAAFLSNGFIHPMLIGSDAGCGMALYQSDMPERKLKKDRFVKTLGDNPAGLLKETAERILRSGAVEAEPDPEGMLGSIGHGNHFAELLAVDEIWSEEAFERLGLGKASLYLLVHSGSRHYGESLWMDFCAKHRDKGVLADSPEGKSYLQRQSELLRWAKANRNLTAEAFFELLNCRGRLILDNCHNSISQSGGGQWLHRKGAACAEGPGPIIVAGSRGSCSYLVEPVGDQRRNLFSIAHGAGRKWTRQSAHGRMEARHTAESLRKTKIGSLVVCPDKKLLYEEAPDAYKRIEQVVQDLLSHGLVRVAASFKPLINCKP